jgi:hypothetical protein
MKTKQQNKTRFVISNIYLLFVTMGFMLCQGNVSLIIKTNFTGR